MGELSKLPNIGKAVEAQLMQVGINTAEVPIGVILNELLVMRLLKFIGRKLFIIICGNSAVGAYSKKPVFLVRVYFRLCRNEGFISVILSLIDFP